MAMDMNMNMEILVLVSVTSLLLSPPSILAAKHPPSTISPRQQRLLSQLQEICNKTTHPSLCANSVIKYYSNTSSFKIDRRVEPVTVLYAGIQATSEYVESAAAEARRLRSDTSFGASVVCEEVYGKVMEVDLRTAVDGILTKDLFVLFTSLQNVGIAATACEEALQATSFEKVPVSVMTEFGEKVSQMGVVCLDLAHMLDWRIHD